MAKGWVKIHRQLIESDIWSDTEPFDSRSAWIDLILMVNHEDKDVWIRGSMHTIRKGQKLTSIRKLAERWHWSNTRVLRYLKSLEKSGMIYKVETLGGTLLTLVKYDNFQGQRNTTDNATSNAISNAPGNATDNATSNQTRIYKELYKELYKEDKEGAIESARFSRFGERE